MLNAVFSSRLGCTFYKLNVHSGERLSIFLLNELNCSSLLGLKPADVQQFFDPIIYEAEELEKACKIQTHLLQSANFDVADDTSVLTSQDIPLIVVSPT